MSAPPIRVRAQAESEIDTIARYIAGRNLEAGKRFYDAVEDAFDKLAQFPGMGARREAQNPKLRELRSWPIAGYRNYLIFYLPLSDGGIEVLHVLHGARNLEELIEQE